MVMYIRKVTETFTRLEVFHTGGEKKNKDWIEKDGRCVATFGVGAPVIKTVEEFRLATETEEALALSRIDGATKEDV